MRRPRRRGIVTGGPRSRPRGGSFQRARCGGLAGKGYVMSVRFAAFAALALMLSGPAAQAAVTHNYQLNGSLADAVLGGPDIVNRAGLGSLGATGITFGADLGPTIGGY